MECIYLALDRPVVHMVTNCSEAFHSILSCTMSIHYISPTRFVFTFTIVTLQTACCSPAGLQLLQ